MKIFTLTLKDKSIINRWKFKEQYQEFNYALDEKGWLNTYGCEKDSFCFVAKENENIIGFFLFIGKKENEFRMLINPKFVNLGYGKTLLSKAIDTAFYQLKFENMSLVVRKYHDVAIKLYTSFGFKIVGEIQEEIEGETIDFYKMTKQKG